MHFQNAGGLSKGKMEMKKPSWLKKSNSKLPWKYKYTTDKGLVIEPYNFDIKIDTMTPDDVEDAINWIEEQMKKKRRI
jgi:hypothetical protein